MLVTAGIVLHRLLERACDADVIHDQTALLALAHAVDAGDGLHEVMALHRLEHVHGGQAGHVEAGEPHVHDDGDLEGIGIVLEPAFHLLLVRGAAAHVEPFLRILVRHGHHHADLVLPFGAQLHDPVVDLHRDRPAVRHDQGLAGQDVGAVVLVMVHDVAAQCVDGLGSVEDGVEAAEVMLGLLHARLVSLVRELLVDRVDTAQRVLVKMERDHTAFVVDRLGGFVLDGLGHVVHVDVVAEDLAGVAVIRGDRRSGETDIGRVRQRLAHDTGRADRHMTVRIDPFGQAVLAAVSLVHHHHNVAPVAQRLVAVRELLHGREDDAVRLTTLKQFLKIPAALGLDRLLAQEPGAAAELSEKLVVEIVAVGDDHDGRAFNITLQQMREEHH